ncbi:acyltransferase family protein [Kriegella aquimaris]|uniref:Peptidoglycan/LPS O-acetylase OafA/YrhL, contains acyltransferase and SGNH-hydrolase domains n=1 Tax=Kriegella aquimaris TaxID=192904 RepID=A0A1G9SAB3_9FLAO|nr:acyltransferase [Kriegella aquimaris]SDM31735.1 Peptidoglycan/LPS O-acetylase OafA/YrhL, contains acyltransferase and SGNH-hydrolase domains [Kriegella aquimaris]
MNHQTKFIPSLTPLRGIAATLVVFFHYHIFIGPLTTPENFMISKLYLMVDLFFVLSGFIMVHVYGEWFKLKIEKGSFLKFIKARFARLYPLHIITFFYLCMWIIYMKSQIVFGQTPAIIQNIFDNTAIFGVLTLTQAWGTHMEATWNTASWSISVEFFLYLLFPFIAWVMNRRKHFIKISLGIGALISLFYLSYVIEPEWIKEITQQRHFTAEQMRYRPSNTIDVITGFALLRGLCSFIFGMITYELYKKGTGKQVLKHGHWFLVIWGGLFLFWFNDLLPDPLAIPIFSFLILQVAYAEGYLRKVLNGKIFTYLGNISYSIYMIHIPIILTVFIVSLIKGEMPSSPDKIDFLQNWVGAFILYVVVIFTASVTYRFIEKPARNKLRRI